MTTPPGRPLPSRQVAQKARRNAEQQQAKLDSIPASRLFHATVASVIPGASTDGRAVVTVTRLGADIPIVAYNRALTFTVGDRVTCVYIDDQPEILHINGGFPPDL